MRLFLLTIFFALFLIPCFAQDKSLIYSENKILGRVLDNKSRPISKIRVCAYPAERPQQGRAPCSTTDDDGNFNFNANIIIDEKYVVCASTLWALIRTNKFPKKYQETCSEPIIFRTKEESKEIELRFKVKVKLK
jgi:hypothetical protein